MTRALVLVVLALASCKADVAPEAEAPAPPAAESSGKRTPCTLGQDQTCNDNPAVSALWGRCTELGVCECKAGFELAPWGRCRPAQ
jgi:hypothetical protein